MAKAYSNENVPIAVVQELRRLGHDVLTSYDAGNANSRIPDFQVLDFAKSLRRIVLTNNRRDFIRLHRSGQEHHGIIVFTLQPDLLGIAQRIDAALNDNQATGQFLARIDGFSFTFEKAKDLK